jgi:hypothetical protein
VSEVQGRRRRWVGRRSGERLGDFPDQHGQHLIWIEISDPKRRMDATLARSCSRRMDRGKMGAFSTEMDLGRSGPAQTLMRSQVSVVVKPQLESALKLSFG